MLTSVLAKGVLVVSDFSRVSQVKLVCSLLLQILYFYLNRRKHNFTVVHTSPFTVGMRSRVLVEYMYLGLRPHTILP